MDHVDTGKPATTLLAAGITYAHKHLVTLENTARAVRVFILKNPMKSIWMVFLTGAHIKAKLEEAYTLDLQTTTRVLLP